MFLDKNRRDTGKFQSKQGTHMTETVRSPSCRRPGLPGCRAPLLRSWCDTCVTCLAAKGIGSPCLGVCTHCDPIPLSGSDDGTPDLGLRRSANPVDGDAD
eukprot:COSAG01_NODE_29067_length_646_cov_0.926874_2_plen_99_part_01